MSSRIGVPARYDTAPVSGSVRRGASVHRRSHSETSSPIAGPASFHGFAFRSTSSRAARAAGGSAPPFSFAGPSLSSTRSSVRAAAAVGLAAEDQLYENYFIGSTKIPKVQNQVIAPDEVSKIEKMNAKIEKESELVSAIKKALGKGKKAHKYPNKVPTRQLSGVLQERANSVMPKNFWSTAEVNAYRTRKI